LYYYQPFHNLISVERLGLDCTVEYTNANQWIIPEVHNICVQYMLSEENDLETPSKDESFFSCIILQLDSTKSDPPISGASTSRESNIALLEEQQEYSEMGITSSTQQYGVVIPTKYQDLHD